MRTWTSMVRVLCAIWLVASSIAFTVSQTQTVLAQQAAFLIPPFYGTKGINTYFDHNLPNYAINNTIALYDGRVAQPGNGVCGHNSQNQAYAYWTQPNATGECIFYEGHDGMDFNLNYERVLAAASGTVSFVGWANITCRTCTYGLYVEITHDNGYITRYGHLSAAAVSSGEYVSQGQVIGTSGNTGNSSGAHLHFGVMNQNRLAVDPSGWCQGCGADPWQTFSGATSWYMWVAGVTVGNHQVISSNVDPTYNPHNADCLSPAVCVEDTANNSGGFRKGSGGPFANVCQNDCGGWTTQNFLGYPLGLDGRLYYAYTNSSAASWAEWQPALPAPGPYEVWVYVPNQGATTYLAQYIINATDRVYSAYVDQYGLNNQWVNIGVYHLMSGPAYVDTIDFTADPVQRLIGADAVKFVPLARYVAFEPDIRAGSGWSGNIMVHNNSSNPGHIYVSILSADGSFDCGTLVFGVSINGRETLPIDGTCGGALSSAVVGSDQDVTIEAENLHTNGQGTFNTATNYTGISPSGQGGNPDWGQAATTLYAPTVKYNLGGRTTDLVIMNAGSASTTLTANYYNDNGSLNQSLSCTNLAPNGRCTLTLSSPAGAFLNAIVTAGQPLAGVAVEYNSDQSQVATYNLLSSSRYTWYEPTFKNYSAGSAPQSTGLRIQNTSAISTSVTVTYYTGGYTSGPHTIPPRGTYLFLNESVLPNPFLGSARITSTQPVVVGEAHEAGTTRKMASSAVGQTSSTTVVVPHICNNCTLNGVSFITGIRIQNLSSATTNVALTYYDSAGNQIGTETISNLGAYVASNASSIPTVQDGSAVITANQPIAALVNLVNTDTSKDLAMTTNAPNR